MATINALIDAWASMSPAAWAQDSYGWITEANRPIALADWQRLILAEYWQRRDDISTLFISCPKKAGKTLLNSLLTCYRWLTRPGVHFALGNDFDQGAMLQGDMIGEMCKRHPILRRYVKINKGELVFLPTNSRLITLPADYAGSSGHNFLTVSFTEVWALMFESHVRLYEELTPPPLVGALRIVDSYAGFDGESELLERVWTRGAQGDRVNDDWPITLNGQQLSYIHQGEDAQKRCWRGSEAQRIAYYQEQKDTLRDNTYNRLHLNQWVNAIGDLVPTDAWLDCIQPDHRPLAPGSHHMLYVGLDLAVSANGDDAVLTAVYSEAGFVKLAFHKMWKGQNRTERLKISESVLPYLVSLKSFYDIGAICYDPWQAYLLAELLESEGFYTIPIQQTHSSRGPRDTVLEDLIKNKRLMLYDNEEVRKASSGASAKTLPNGQIFLQKGGSGKKIDFMVSLSNCAYEAAENAGDVYIYINGERVTYEEMEVV